MSGADGPVEELEECILECLGTGSTPMVRVVDLAWSCDKDQRYGANRVKEWAEDLDFYWARPKWEDRSLRKVVGSFAGEPKYDLQILILSDHGSASYERRVVEVREEVISQQRKHIRHQRDAVITVLELGPGYHEPDDVKSKIAAVALEYLFDRPKLISEPIDERLGVLVRSKIGESATVVVVGGNEKQALAASKFGGRVTELFGLAGQWILADYNHPERPVEELTRIESRSLALVLFAQRFNATNTKRSGLKYCRNVGVQAETPEIKGLESALECVRSSLSRLFGNRDRDLD